MAYITISNSKKIMKSLSEISLDEIEIDIYKKEIYFFNRKERAMLKGVREFLRDPENFKALYYKPIVVNDSLKYVYPESQPAYHKDDCCLGLHSNFVNFEIPDEIRNQGKEAVVQFRSWFAENKHFLESDIKVFIEKMQDRFQLTDEITPKSIDYRNSGSEERQNYSLEEIESEIDEVLRQASRFYRDNPDKQMIIKKFGKLTFLANVYGNIYTNNSNLNDDELKEFLRMYEEKFKKPVKHLLLEYYRLLHKPDMTFSDTLLDEIGFKRCIRCYESNQSYIVDSI